MAQLVDILHAQDSRATTVNGQTLAGATDNIRVINTVKTNTITGASLSANRITLPAGTYLISMDAVSSDVGQQRLTWYNVTDAADEYVGPSGFADGFTHFTPIRMIGYFVITSEKVFECRHYTAATPAGSIASIDDGTVEIYLDIYIEKIA